MKAPMRGSSQASRQRFFSTLYVLLLLTIGVLRAGDGPPQAAIASAHPLATAAGFEILKTRGNAFDAAVVVSAALAMVEHYRSGLGGGFWLLHRAEDGRELMLDGRERHRWRPTATCTWTRPAASCRSCP